MTLPLRLAAVELGGTKAIAVLSENGQIVRQLTFPTTGPGETLETLNGLLLEWDAVTPLDGLGIASFGPLQLDSTSPLFATILDTPKAGWKGAEVGSRLVSGLSCPWAIETDVNAAALAEVRRGSAVGCDSICYLTIGTGVGGGLVIGGRPVHGALHPEIGHLCLRRVPHDEFAGTCRFHSDCIEGLVSGPALASRFGVPAAEIPDDHPGWRNVERDIGELVAAILLTTSAERVILGGTVALARANLLAGIRNHVVSALGGYLPQIDHGTIGEVVVLSSLGAMAGPLGAITVAELVLGL